ncbi:type VII secretion protein EsaA [Enterococcus caccae]|uniref:Type VII secretion system accessory factor EsaA n=1 Tax=Enterococcus caccae ATCC BAA-1240 TaxID=1158612 RepID=R3WC75_9ENTE|nr:type VII secretion protein EsaA [Enterococcus caccae]EOL45067.1 type VII secretion protein EsaA [Enterococcus caccae ATCC BAA-1240]EOT58474.1 type VII secretion protein EsaA [Enterococcus caccae ATCC BAA-1240]OJG24869.1 type VII secretion protein EsaA [Enterococcus caccae]
MKNKLKKYLPVISIVFSSILFLSILSYIGFKSDNIQQTSNEKVTKMQYVLVNEDKGTLFEGKKYSLGTDFVTLINQDTANRWETTTRDIASRGVTDGQFDAQIIIPQDFSERLLSLQSINPEKALVEYQVREGQNEITNQAIQVKVNDILKDFNQRIVQMYFSSIVGNLSEAQQNVNQIVGLETNHKNNLEKTIYLPFKEVPTNFSNVIDTASILDEDNKMFTSEQKAFVQSVKQLMESNNAGLEANSQSTEEVQKSVNDYADEANKKLETSIKQFNAQFELQKEQLEAQWQNDLKGYKAQYDGFDESINNQLGLFLTKGSEESKDTGVYANFLTNAYAFKETQSKRIKELTSEIKDLEKQVTELTTLKEDVAEKYYNDKNADSETAEEDQVKLAISKLISPVDKDSEIKEDGEYLTAVKNELQKLQEQALPSSTDFPILLAKLVGDGLLTPSESDKLSASYNLVTHYDPTLTSGNGNQFNILSTVPKEDRLSNFNVTNTVNVDLTRANQSVQFGHIFNAGSSGEVKVINMGTIRDNLEREILRHLSGSDYTATVSNDETQLTIAIILKDTESTEPPKAPVNSNMSYTFDSQIQWTYPDDSSDHNEYYQCNYFWKWNNSITASGQLAAYIDKDQPLKQDLPELFSLFTILTSAAEKLTTIYADPTQQDVASFAGYVTSNPDKSFNELATPNSVYWLYDNVTDTKKVSQISESLYKNYRENGDSLYKDIVAQIDKLNATIGTRTDKNEGEAMTLYGTLNLMTVPDMMLQEASTLGEWFDKASQEIDTTYNSWKETERVAAESVITDTNAHPDKNDTAAINATTESLVKNIQTLASSSKETAKTTEESAAQVKDVAPIIQTLKESTNKVQTDANGILTNLDKTVTEVHEKTNDNAKYAETFDKVLSNTRNGGSDNTTVFNFLSNPIQEKGDFGKTRQNSLIPYYATIIAAFIIILVATGMQKYMKRRKVSKTDLLMNPSRAWYNTSNVIVILLSSVALSVAFALNLSLVVGMNAKIAWFSYAFLVLFAGLLLTLGCMRQFRLLTLYLSGAILGLFFMLTPLLGVATKTGTFTNILYRVSPLQNIQNGFTALLNGSSIGWVSYLILVVLAVSGILLNFWVKPEDKKVKA